MCRGKLGQLRPSLSRSFRAHPRAVRRVWRKIRGQRKEHGPCLRALIKGKNKVTFVHRRGRLLSRLYLTRGGRIGGLWFDAALPNKDSLAAVAKALRGLGGDVAITVRKRTGNALLQVNAQKPLAVASAFKLSVLKTIVARIKAKRLGWGTVVVWKGGDFTRPYFPSGFLPKGALVTVESLATSMMMTSDNAATDRLIQRLGRTRVEKHAPKRNRPLLTTTEMSKLKSTQHEGLAKRYMGAKSVAARRKILRQLSPLALSRDWGKHPPRHIRELEWFYTTDELCDLAFELRQTRLFRAVAKRKRHAAIWDRFVFKGGAEPGVRNLTYALRHRTTKAWYCISATWNNPKQRRIRGKLRSLVQRVLHLLAKPTTPPNPSAKSGPAVRK